MKGIHWGLLAGLAGWMAVGCGGGSTNAPFPFITSTSTPNSVTANLVFAGGIGMVTGFPEVNTTTAALGTATTVNTGGSGEVSSIVVDAGARLLFAAEGGSITAFSVSSDGSTAVATTTTVSESFQLAVAGNFLYSSAGSTISVFQIGPNGQLTAATGTTGVNTLDQGEFIVRLRTVTVGGNTFLITVQNHDPADIVLNLVNADGSLVSTPAGTNNVGVAGGDVVPYLANGQQFILAVGEGTDLATFSVANNGSLTSGTTQTIPNVQITEGGALVQTAGAANPQAVFVASSVANTGNLFEVPINSAGALQPPQTFNVPGNIRAIAPDPTGNNFYVVTEGPASIIPIQVSAGVPMLGTAVPLPSDSFSVTSASVTFTQ